MVFRGACLHPAIEHLMLQLEKQPQPWRLSLTNWRQLLSRTIVGLEQLEQQGQAVPDWILGGGTALMLHSDHRLSRDIDAFIDDPQYLGSCRRRSPTFGTA